MPVHASEILAGHGFAGIRESTDRRQISIHHYGYGMAPLRVGRLDGNSFRIVVRNLDPEVAGQIGATRKISFCALNYYDTQRFGVPTGPKLTHILGACLLKGDWQGAFDTLLMLGAPESPLAERWEGRPEAFFEERLDPRVVSFYLSAYASHEWNRALEAVVADAGPDRSYIETVDGIDYRYLWTSQAAADILAKRPDLPYRRLTLDREIAETSSSRATVVQVPLLLEAAEPDDMHPGKSSAVLRFALPSGCYATCVVRQLLIPLRGARQPAPSP